MKILVRLVLGLVVFLAFDHAVFSEKVYGRWADPTSTAGRIVAALDSADHMRPGSNAVLVLGDSRVGEGFSAVIADDVSARSGYTASFGNLAVPGTTPRVWYYLLRQISLQRHHVKIVVIMLTSYHDNDSEDLADKSSDIAFLHPLIGPMDLFDLPFSFKSSAAKVEAAQAVLLKGLSFSSDVHDFLSAPRKRILTMQGWHEHGSEWLRIYSGNAGSLGGLAFDPASFTLTLPPHIAPALADKLREYSHFLTLFRGRPPDNAPSHMYRAEWLPRIEELCAAAHARLVAFRIPRGPLDFLVDSDAAPSGVVAQMQEAGKLVLLPGNMFDHLERPEYFADQLHMNALGRSIFSRELAAVLLDRLGTRS